MKASYWRPVDLERLSMAKVVKRTFSATVQQAEYIDRKVGSGSYASGSEVVRAGLRAMADDDATIDRWLREEVVPAIAELEANPELARSADEVFEEILAELRERESERRRA
jgi:antitoxin ParD1/3/4